jgi:hypothetical protein
MPYEKTKLKMPSGFVDLGEKMSPIDLGEPMEKTEYHYPSLYFSDVKGLEKLPSSGEATIFFKKVMDRKESTTINGETKNRHSVELCICGIKADGVEQAEEPEEEEESDEDEIEKGLSEAEDETKKPKIEIEIES